MLGFVRSRRSQSAHRSPRSRRGTVVLLALAFLAIVSIAALAYVTLVRVDRASSVALQRQQNYQQQVTAVVSEIQSLLTADLFGNKVVTPSTPTTVLVDGQDVDVLPRFFEDGESYDYPYTNTRVGTGALTTDLGPDRPTYTFAPSPLTPPNSPLWNAARLGTVEIVRQPPETNGRRFLAALPDDAWLASYDPIWDLTNPSDTTSWSQITNMRSAYRFVRDTNGDGRVDGTDRPAWQRQDGLFADLSRFFKDPTPDGFGNPAANLLVEDTANPNGPDNLRADRGANQVTPDDARYTGVLQFNMAQLGREMGDSSNDVDTLDAADEAQWADTDGDLRPDSRWTQLDSLGELYGLKWVVAARIVDASALINVNSAVEFTYGPSPDDIATGATPADIDLFRLLNESNMASAYSGTIRTDQLQTRQFRAHIEQTLGVGELINELTVGSGIRRDPWVRSSYTPWQFGGTRLKPDQRDAFWRYLGAAPDRPAYSRGGSYPLRDMIDLFAFSGTNNRGVVSKIEESFDGPEAGGYLPGGTAPGLLTGPMRAKESPVRARSLMALPPTGLRTPTLEQLQQSVRRYLTAVNGVSLYSPVPTADGQTPMPKVGLRDFMPPPPGAAPTELNAYLRRKPELVKRTFSGLVWALAPFATDGPLPAPLDAAGDFNDRIEMARQSTLAYGGGRFGLANALTALSSGDGVAQGYAVLVAASLAANIADAVDGTGVVSAPLPPFDDDDTGSTVIRFFPDPNRSDDPSTPNVIEMGTRLTQGTIYPDAISSTLFGPPATPSSTAFVGGISIIGFERQLYLSEVTTMAAYSDEILDGGDGDGQISHSDRFGSAIFVHIVNPPGAPRASTQGYRVRIPVNRTTLDGRALSFELPATFINGGDSAVFYYLPQRAAQSTARDLSIHLNSRLGSLMFASQQQAAMSLIGPDAMMGTGDDTMLFQDIDPTERPPVLLTRVVNGFEVFIDRLSPPDDDVAPPVGNDEVGGFPARVTTSFPVQTPPIAYANNVRNDVAYWSQFASPPYSGGDSRFMNNEFSGKATIWSSITRPGTQRGAPLNGTPAYVMESNNGRLNTLRQEINGALWLRPFGGGDPAEAFTIISTPQAAVDGLVVGTYSTPLLTSAPNQSSLTLAPVDKPASANLADTVIAPFQLFVPNAPLSSVSDIALVSTAATTYRHESMMDDLSGLSSLSPAGSTASYNLANLVTAGEWLFRDLTEQHEINDTAPGTVPNPYIGTLDLAGYNLRDFLDEGPVALVTRESLPESLCVPLATRVFELFDSQAPVERLLAEGVTKTQGRININTAPRRVLQMVPFLAPSQAVQSATATLSPDPAGSSVLAPLLAYRDQFPSPSPTVPDTLDTPESFTALPTLRSTGLSALAGLSEDLPAGIAMTGELALIGRWADTAAGASVPDPAGPRAFLEFAADGSDMGTAPFTGSAPAGVTVSDDAEERLGIFHGVANSVTTRSDVYIAWFIIRGYDPKTIEGIPVAGDPYAAMKDETFRPAYESRWLAVLDRSNVRQPTDRPKVLLLVELPKTGG